MKKRIVKLLAACVLCTRLGSSQAFAETTKIPIIHQGEEVTTFCMTFGMLRHPNMPTFREQNNLSFDGVNMDMSLVPVAVSNQDAAIAECTGISTIMNAWIKGAKNLIVFAIGSVAPVYQLIASPSIARLEDLKGKKIGSPGIQSGSTEAIEMILRRGANLIPSKDYNFVSVGAGSARIAALRAGSIDALSSYPPDTYQLTKLGYKILADESDYVPQYVTGAEIVSREWAEKNKDALVRVIKGMVEAGEWLENPANKDDVIAWMSKNIHSAGVALGDAYAADLYRFYVTQNRLAFNGYAPEAAVRANLDILKERGFITDAAIPPLGKVFDFSYLNTALKELGRPTVAEYPATGR